MPREKLYQNPVLFASLELVGEAAGYQVASTAGGLAGLAMWLEFIRDCTEASCHEAVLGIKQFSDGSIPTCPGPHGTDELGISGAGPER